MSGSAYISLDPVDRSLRSLKSFLDTPKVPVFAAASAARRPSAASAASAGARPVSGFGRTGDGAPTLTLPAAAPLHPSAPLSNTTGGSVAPKRVAAPPPTPPVTGKPNARTARFLNASAGGGGGGGSVVRTSTAVVIPPLPLAATSRINSGSDVLNETLVSPETFVPINLPLRDVALHAALTNGDQSVPPPAPVSQFLDATSHRNRNAYFKHTYDRFDRSGGLFDVLPATIELVAGPEGYIAQVSAPAATAGPSTSRPQTSLHRRVGLRDSMHHGAVHGSSRLPLGINSARTSTVRGGGEAVTSNAGSTSSRVVRARMHGKRPDIYAEDESLLTPAAAPTPAPTASAEESKTAPDVRYAVRSHRAQADGVHAAASDERARRLIQTELGHKWRRIQLIRRTHPNGTDVAGTGSGDGPWNVDSVVWGGVARQENAVAARRAVVSDRRREWIRSHRDNGSTDSWTERPFMDRKRRGPNSVDGLQHTFERIWRVPHPNSNPQQSETKTASVEPASATAAPAAATAAATVAAPATNPNGWNHLSARELARTQRHVNEETRGRSYNVITGTVLPLPPTEVKAGDTIKQHTHPSIWTVGRLMAAKPAAASSAPAAAAAPAVAASATPPTATATTAKPVSATPSTPAKPETKEAARSASPPPAAAKKNKKIDKKHPEFELTYDMMLGIRTSVSQIESKPKRNLKDADMQAVNRMKFPASGGSLTPAHQMRDYKFKDYAPEVFRQIRERFDINPMEYILSVCGNFEYLEFVSNSKSGQFFFYTHDRKYMIKTISGDECAFLRKILPDYYSHIVKHPNTLLTRFYGMHRVKPHKNKEFHFLIMGSVFYTDKFIHLTFDLKGSTHGRAATEKEKKVRDNCVYKDLDFLRMKQQFELGMVKAELLNKQLAADADFLRKLNIMDYSLLLGVHFTDKLDEPLPRYTIDHGRSAPPTPNAAATRPTGDAKSSPAGAPASSPAIAIPNHTALPPAAAGATPGSSVSVSVSTGAGGSVSSVSPVSSVSSSPSVSSVGTPSASASSVSSPASSATTPIAGAPLLPGLAPLPSFMPVLPTATTAPATPEKKAPAPALITSHTNADGTIQTEAMEDPLATPRNSAMYALSPTTKDGVIRRQSHYGVPKNHQILTPALINFKAPDLAVLPAGAAGAAAAAVDQRNAPAANAAASATGGPAAAAAGGANAAPLASANGKGAGAGDAKHAADQKKAGMHQSVFTCEDGGIRSVDPLTGRPGNQIYFLGIIDILTLYDAKKKIESFAKGLTHDSNAISAVNPSAYASRFCKFIGAAVK